MLLSMSENTVTVGDRKGDRWAYARTDDGALYMQCVRVEPDGSIVIAPHASLDDLRAVVGVLAAEVHRMRSADGTISVPQLSIEVRI